MNDTQVTKRKIGRMIAKNLIVMLVAVIVALTGVLAWFTNKTSAEASGVSVECKAPDGIEIAVVAKGETPKNNDFHEDSITLGKQVFLDELNLSEVTSDGITFYRPVLNQLGGTAIPDPSKEWEDENDIINKSYISFDLYIRSKSEQDIYLCETSKFSTPSRKLTGADADNKSSMGDFSRDCIVGATRLSVVGYNSTDGTPERKLLWIPRPDLKFYVDDNDNTNHVNEGLTDTSATNYQHTYWNVIIDENGAQIRDDKATTMTSGVTTSVQVNGDFVLGEKNKTKITELRSPLVPIEIDDKGTIETYYMNHVTVNIWIEGEDDEARLALVNGNFKVNLDLSLK